MKIEVKEKVWVVYERWNLDIMEHDVHVFDTKEKATAYAEEQAVQTLKYITNGTIKRYGDEKCYNCCDIYIDDDEGKADEWWEAYIKVKEIE
jgi:hypothetical protein